MAVLPSRDLAGVMGKTRKSPCGPVRVSFRRLYSPDSSVMRILDYYPQPKPQRPKLRRLAAQGVDMIILTAFCMPGALLCMDASFGNHDPSPMARWIGVGMIIFLTIDASVGSLGKRLLKMRVLTLSGRAEANRNLLRSAIKYAPLILWIVALMLGDKHDGYLLFLFTALLALAWLASVLYYIIVAIRFLMGSKVPWDAVLGTEVVQEAERAASTL